MPIKPKQRICNLVPSRETETDWTMESAIQARAVEIMEALPESADLRARWWTIGDQENTGSCVGWATADGVMRYHMHKAGRIGDKELLSPRQVWMASKETDKFTAHATTFIEHAGTSLKAAIEVCLKWGVATEQFLPFHIDTLMFPGSEADFYAQSGQRRIAAYFNLQKDLDQWRKWLAFHGPLLAGLSVDATWDNATDTHGRLDRFQPKTVRGGHAVCIVGYTDDKRFIIRNSWGASWGDGGFAYASEAYVKEAFFNESYGATL
jgi:C1A family cysteine protease